MASRVVEVLYKLKDLFTPGAKKVTKGYEDIAKSSTVAADTVEKNQTKTQSAIRRTSSMLGRLRAAWLALGGIIAGRALVGSVNELADELDRLGKTARRLDIDPGSLAAFEFAAERSGLAVTKVTSALETLQKRTGEALQGIGEARKGFEVLGISAAEFSELDVEGQLRLLAERFQGLTSAEERAAVASQLFSKANIDLLNVLDGGGEAFQALIDQGKEYTGVTKEATQAAEDYNDALTNLGASLAKAKRSAFTPLIRELNQWIGAVGLAGSETAQLRADLEDARRTIQGFADGLNPKALEEAKENYASIRRELDALEASTRKSTETNTEYVESVKESEEASENYKKSIKGLNKEYSEQTRELKSDLNTQKSDLRNARRDMANIEKEFNDLINQVTTGAVRPEDVTLGDIFARINQGAAAAERGELGRAIELSREGADLLGKLEDKGSETTGTLKFLAEQLKSVATEAAAGQVAAEQTDVARAQQAFDVLSTQQEIFKEQSKEAGKESAQEWLQGWTDIMAQTASLPTPPVATPSSPVLGLIEGTSNEYGRRTSGRQNIDGKIVK